MITTRKHTAQRPTLSLFTAAAGAAPAPLAGRGPSALSPRELRRIVAEMVG